MLMPDQQKRYVEFYEGARNSGILEPNTTTLIGLAAAMAVGCSP